MAVFDSFGYVSLARCRLYVLLHTAARMVQATVTLSAAVAWILGQRDFIISHRNTSG